METKFQHPKYKSIKTCLPMILDNQEKSKISNQFEEFKKSNKKFNSIFTNLIKTKINNDIYNFNYIESLQSTYNFLFDNINNGIYVKIKNNKVKEYIPFSNLDYKNEYFKNMKIPKKYKNINEFFKKKHKYFPIKKNNYEELDKTKWTANNCLIFTERGKQPYINDQYMCQIHQMFQQLCNNRKIPDIQFFINRKDLQYLKKTRFHPFENVYGNNYPINNNKYYYFLPILSQSTRDEYADIPIPSVDTWNLLNNINIDINIKWKDKINTAFFRGRDTGCSLKIEENPRLKITQLNFLWKNNDNYNQNNPIDGIPFLNAGIISYSKRLKINNGMVDFHNIKKLKNNNIHLMDFVSMEEQSKYKYVIYIEGNSAAYRLAHMLKFNSLILKVDSKYKLWFEDLLKPYKHYIPIKHDLMDLDEKIKWCKLNDNKCYEIVKNANQFYKKYINKESIYDYLQEICYNIASKQFRSKDITKKFNLYKDNRIIMEKIKFNLTNKLQKSKSIIIVPYRDNKLQDRKKQLNKFIDFWKNKDIPVFIIKQSNDNNKFNRGQLLNLGAKIATNYDFDNFIFHDIDLLPDQELLKYYYYITKYPIHIASIWNKYTHFTFFGGITIINKDLFTKSNGYPNNFWGWGGEDDVLYNRISKYNNNIYIPNTGSIYEMKHKNTSDIKSSTLNNIIKKKLIIQDYYYNKNNKNNGIKNLTLSNNLKFKQIYNNIKIYNFNLNTQF